MPKLRPDGVGLVATVTDLSVARDEVLQVQRKHVRPTNSCPSIQGKWNIGVRLREELEVILLRVVASRKE